MNDSPGCWNYSIVIKPYITDTEFAEITRLESLCQAYDGTNLKLEADYRLHKPKSAEYGMKKQDEFLYYADGMLVAYLGIASFGGSNIAELNGMTHPDFRRKGLFTKLYSLALEECRKRSFAKILLLSDGKSESGQGFIHSVSGVYDFSENYMLNRHVGSTDQLELARHPGPVTLQKACNGDVPELERLDQSLFGGTGAREGSPEEEELRNEITYLVERNGASIGKIKITYEDASAFISGFGIAPEHRRQGFGRAALREALKLISGRQIPQAGLDVESKNANALELYKSCGFEQISVMSYYVVQ